jgi:RimJ/RimL family protein N-acetyltransferase
MPFPLETERLHLRRFRISDLEDLLSYRNDPVVARYQGWELPYTRESGSAFLLEMVSALPGEVGKWFQVAIELKSSKELIGDCAFHVMASDPRQAFIGITLARPYWRKGYGEEAACCLLDYLFSELYLHRIVAECDIENIASIKLLDRIGFRKEAHLLENIWFKGKWGSEYHYAILENEWKNK